MSRPKAVLISEVSDLLRGWDTPVFLDHVSPPASFAGVPDELRYGFIVSGELMAPCAFESHRFGHTNRVGGIYVLRDAPDDPKPFNREDYNLVPSPRFPEQLWRDGPYRHPTEHWADHDEVRQILDVCVI